LVEQKFSALLLSILLIAAGCHEASEAPLADAAADAGPAADASGDLAVNDLAVAAPSDLASATGDLSTCTPSCGGMMCGSDGCGGSCGSCVSPAWCGGGGQPGQCGTSSTIGAYPGVTPTQIDPGAALGLLVASDEKHVLVQRTETVSGPNAFSQGALAVVTLDATGSHAVELTQLTDFTNGVPRAGFSADATGLYYVDVTTTPMHLVVANADGTSARTLVSGTVQFADLARNTLVYTINPPTGGGNRSVWAVALPSGNPVSIVAAGALYYPTATANPTGTAVFVTDQNGSAYQLVQTATGTASPVGSAGQTLSGLTWSPDGAHLAYRVGDEQRAPRGRLRRQR
jgi:hypothetical protein